MTQQLLLAKKVSSALGLVPTWPNLRTIEIALVFEAADSSVSLKEAADRIVECGRVFMQRPPRELLRYWPINRFWFEDAKWKEIALPCRLHPNSGLTPNGSCYMCYAEKYQSGCRIA